MLYQAIKTDVAASFKARDSAKTNLLKTFLGDAENAARAKVNRAPTDEEIIKLLRKYVNNANLMIEAAEKSGRDITPFQTEILILSAYLPAEVSDDEIVALIQTAMQEADAPSGGALFGYVMGCLKDKLGERFDGKKVAPLVKKILSA